MNSPRRAREPSAEVLKQWFRYDAKLRALVWVKAPRFRPHLAGKVAGSPNKAGYWFVCLLGKQYLVHRLIWTIVNGAIPDGIEVDHRDTDVANNDISNLRLATKQEQMRNRNLHKNNKSGVKGVSYHAAHAGKKWRAQLSLGRSKKVLTKYCTTKEEARAAYAAMVAEHFGEFGRSDGPL